MRSYRKKKIRGLKRFLPLEDVLVNELFKLSRQIGKCTLKEYDTRSFQIWEDQCGKSVFPLARRLPMCREEAIEWEETFARMSRSTARKPRRPRRRIAPICYRYLKK